MAHIIKHLELSANIVGKAPAISETIDVKVISTGTTSITVAIRAG
ncbi:hypothetical protein [Skermania sp. ID1734]|nr:hypothetical protein [Skermania sp. ID1734]